MKIDINSISVQLLALVLIMAIMPVIILTYNNYETISSDKYKQFEDKINDVSAMVEKDYEAQMDRNNNAAVRISLDRDLSDAVANGDNATVKKIIEAYFQEYNFFDILTVYDNRSYVIARATTDRSDDYSPNDQVALALNGTESRVTDIVPKTVIDMNDLKKRPGIHVNDEGLAVINCLPIYDSENNIIGAVYTAQVQNNNFGIVDSITNESGAYCTIFQGDTRIATTLVDTNNSRIVGTRASAEVANKVLNENQVFRGMYTVNNKQLYVHYEPLKNGDNKTVGMLFVGYDIEPGLAELYKMQMQAAIIAIAASLLSVCIGYLIVTRVTTPVRKLVTIADSIASGNLDAPVETGAKGGEIGELSNSIKKMVDYMVTNIKDKINFNESILKGISDPMLVVDNDRNILFFNEPASKLTGYTAKEAMGKKCYSIFKAHICYNCIGSDDCWKKVEIVQGYETVIETRDHRKVIVRGSSAPIKDANGNIIGAIELFHDITMEKEVEKRIMESLKEKEVLLKEIHHRVKNNLQIISSLLSLQSGYIKDQESLKLFKESQNRVKSMALIHEKLYQSKDFTRIDFAEYIRSLTVKLFHSYGLDMSKVTFNINVDHLSLGIDTAIPCGLIINELVSNSLKYAFPDGRNGEININLRLEDPKGHVYLLRVQDNGVGFPEDIDFRDTDSLGLQIVTTLTTQLGGKIELDRAAGTDFTIRFSEAKVK